MSVNHTYDEWFVQNGPCRAQLNEELLSNRDKIFFPVGTHFDHLIGHMLFAQCFGSNQYSIIDT